MRFVFAKSRSNANAFQKIKIYNYNKSCTPKILNINKRKETVCVTECMWLKPWNVCIRRVEWAKLGTMSLRRKWEEVAETGEINWTSETNSTFLGYTTGSRPIYEMVLAQLCKEKNASDPKSVCFFTLLTQFKTHGHVSTACEYHVNVLSW